VRTGEGVAPDKCTAHSVTISRHFGFFSIPIRQPVEMWYAPVRNVVVATLKGPGYTLRRSHLFVPWSVAWAVKKCHHHALTASLRLAFTRAIFPARFAFTRSNSDCVCSNPASACACSASRTSKCFSFSAPAEHWKRLRHLAAKFPRTTPRANYTSRLLYPKKISSRGKNTCSRAASPSKAK